jgi:transmembrane sensor
VASMTKSSNAADEEASIIEQAAAWRVALGAQDSRRLPEFWQWVTRSPTHVREALVMGLLNQALRDLDSVDRGRVDPSASGDVAELQSVPATVRTGSVRRWMRSTAAIAACIALFLVVGLFIRIANHKVVSETFTTGIGEQRSVTLSDGSTVVLDAESRLLVRLSGRERLFQLEGQALFNVAHDPSRPFRVHTTAATIEAVGTEFNVRTELATTVAVLDGAVRFYPGDAERGSGRSHGESSPGSATLTAGEAVSISGNGQITERRKVDRATATAWEQRRLIFFRAPLEDIVHEFNRYDRKERLHVEGKAASLRFGGVFDAMDPGPLLLILAKNPSVVVERTGDDLLIRDKH